jgi:hypothetical protein
MLDLFEEFEVDATWATVGLLLARSDAEQRAFSPTLKPTYADTRLDPYLEPVGTDEADDPFHFGLSIVESIRARPGQEIGTHTFSHYYCLEPGQTEEQFIADIAAAVAIGEARGSRPRSIVLPRNQLDPAYLDAMRQHGITTYRGNTPSWLYRTGASGSATSFRRAGRLAYEYVGPGPVHLTRWETVRQPSGAFDVPASMFVRGFSPCRRVIERPRIRRITRAMREAASSGRILHLWWHPHNFGAYPAENAAMLRQILTEFDRIRRANDFHSLSMGGVTDALTGQDGDA